MDIDDFHCRYHGITSPTGKGGLEHEEEPSTPIFLHVPMTCPPEYDPNTVFSIFLGLMPWLQWGSGKLPRMPFELRGTMLTEQELGYFDIERRDAVAMRVRDTLQQYRHYFARRVFPATEYKRMRMHVVELLRPYRTLRTFGSTLPEDAMVIKFSEGALCLNTGGIIHLAIDAILYKHNYEHKGAKTCKVILAENCAVISAGFSILNTTFPRDVSDACIYLCGDLPSTVKTFRDIVRDLLGYNLRVKIQEHNSWILRVHVMTPCTSDPLCRIMSITMLTLKFIFRQEMDIGELMTQIDATCDQWAYDGLYHYCTPEALVFHPEFLSSRMHTSPYESWACGTEWSGYNPVRHTDMGYGRIGISLHDRHVLGILSNFLPDPAALRAADRPEYRNVILSAFQDPSVMLAPIITEKFLVDLSILCTHVPLAIVTDRQNMPCTCGRGEYMVISYRSVHDPPGRVEKAYTICSEFFTTCCHVPHAPIPVSGCSCVAGATEYDYSVKWRLQCVNIPSTGKFYSMILKDDPYGRPILVGSCDNSTRYKDITAILYNTVSASTFLEFLDLANLRGKWENRKDQCRSLRRLA